MTPTGPAPTAAAHPAPAVDVVTLGESMVTFLPSRPGRLADVPSFDRAIGGAESNVACVLAAAGHTARWVSRVGADGFGDHLTEAIGAYGVDTSAVQRDPTRPTGIYFRTASDRSTDAHEVAYYRTGSAASAMSKATLDMAAVNAGRILHLSGITAALSPDCRSLLTALTAPHPDRPLISFDVNYRAGLWPTPSKAGATLLTLARGADLVFVGEDEAEAAWGITGGPTAIRAALPEPRVLVVKAGSQGATAFETAPPTHPHPPTDGRGRVGGCPPAADGVSTRSPSQATDSTPDRGRTPPGAHPPPTTREGDQTTARYSHTTREGDQTTASHPNDTVTFVPALQVDVVAPVGAGDAFAAGFLSATLRGLPPRARLRHGHLMAAAALTDPGDLGAPPSRDHADRLAALDDDAWGTLRLGPGWTHTADRAQEEVPTP
ncbi:sugar kinase [Streptomyces sp. NBC_00258]|uniref:sugar kinase n=1 Tax=Streptomyces sp. NBC_00258 TaxID=2903642 RepID=UPI002E2BC788|nr:sugar kinase [Streptomyces sp. NBC_00258]